MEHSFNELHPRLAGGRAYSLERRPGFADCAPSGRIRLDAIAGWLQDIAYADVEDAGLAATAVWVVRRTRIRVRRFPRFGERFALTTFCSGLGRMWAERRTDVRGGDGDAPGEPLVEAVSLWVHLAPDSWRPVPLTESEITTYGGAVTERRVSARLRHPAPPERAVRAPWTFRLTECDMADHVNNAAYWQPLEEELLAGPEPARLDAEIEYRTPTQAGEYALLRSGPGRWIVGPDGELHASLMLGSETGDE